jgi:hypothetical protein
MGSTTAGQITSAGGGVLQIANIAQSNAPTSTKIEGSIGAGLLAAAPFAGPAAPFLAVAGIAAELLASFGVGSGCGQSCILSSQYANQAENVFRQNITTYFNLPVPRDPTAQAAALRIFDSIWTDLVAQCSVASLGTAGKTCISDRQSGACKWKATADSPWPGGPAQGACWNWFNAYRDPIAIDENVSASSVVSGAVSELSSLPTWALALAAVALVAVLS